MIPAAAVLAVALAMPAFATSLDLAGTWRLALEPPSPAPAAGPAGVRFDDTILLSGTTDLGGKGERRTKAPDHEHHLTREFFWLGPAWYQREIEIPEAWRGRRVEWVMERVMWQSRVWLDDREPSPPGDSLSVPHVHCLGRVGTEIEPGIRRLTLRIDNRMIHPIGDKGHAYGDQMQSIWNGAVGTLALRAIAPGDPLRVRLFPDAAKREVRAELMLEPAAGTTPPGGVMILRDPEGNEIARGGFGAPPADGGPLTLTLPLATAAKLWSEFDQPLYQAEIVIDPAGEARGVWRERFGFRTIGRSGQRLAVNGRPAFFRGNLECAAFPLTGHPPVDVEAWRRIWRIYREHNLNHARFHSWCPPRAAFEAADELGIYLQVEAPIWMDRWMAGPNPRPEMNTQGHPQGLGKSDRTNDEFARAEIRRILDEYGNHPSFVLFCIGNELGSSNFDVIGRWMADSSGYDPRRLYAASTARTITEHCDYNATHQIPGVGAVRGRFAPNTDWNYEENFGRAPVPILAHETGQVPVYPDWDEVAKFTGPLKNFRLAAMREEARAAGILDDAPGLRAASGALNRLLNREELEGFFRTPSCAGFQLLSMQDFTGQGEAYVGWRDIFYDDKGTTAPADFRQWCAPTVPLLELTKRVWHTGERLTAAALVHHSGREDALEITLRWSLATTDGRELATGTLPAATVKVGEVARAGAFEIDLSHIPAPAELRLTLTAAGRDDIRNSYPLWVFPARQDLAAPWGVLLTDDWSAAKEALAAGGRVVFFTDRVGSPGATALAAWRPLYWSVPFFPGQHPQTLGLLVRNGHPALAGFPTPAFNDWLWHDICAGARGFDLTGVAPAGWKPIAQPVTDFHLNRALGSLFELRVGPGKLLVSGYSLAEARARRHPEVAGLRRSLLNYAASAAFAPDLKLAPAVLDGLFPEPPPELAALPEGFAGADLYIRAAGRLAERAQNRPLRAEDDQVLARAAGVNYHTEADGAWRDDSGSAWHGKRLRVVLETRAGVPGTLHLRFHDWNRNGRRGTVTIEGETLDLGEHTEARWIRFPVIREHTNDGRIVIAAAATAGPNLMLTDIAFVPTE